MECSKSSSKREVYSHTILPQETRSISNKQPNLTPKATRERRTNKTHLAEGKKSEIRAEVNETEVKKTIEKINQSKTWFFKTINETGKPLLDSSEKKGTGFLFQ